MQRDITKLVHSFQQLITYLWCPTEGVNTQYDQRHSQQHEQSLLLALIECSEKHKQSSKYLSAKAEFKLPARGASTTAPAHIIDFHKGR